MYFSISLVFLGAIVPIFNIWFWVGDFGGFRVPLLAIAVTTDLGTLVIRHQQNFNGYLHKLNFPQYTNLWNGYVNL